MSSSGHIYKATQELIGYPDGASGVFMTLHMDIPDRTTFKEASEYLICVFIYHPLDIEAFLESRFIDK